MIARQLDGDPRPMRQRRSQSDELPAEEISPMDRLARLRRRHRLPRARDLGRCALDTTARIVRLFLSFFFT